MWAAVSWSVVSAEPTKPLEPLIDGEAAARAERWASTMRGHGADDVVVAHADSHAGPGDLTVLTREVREEREAVTLAASATRAHGAGNRAVEEAPDPLSR